MKYAAHTLLPLVLLQTALAARQVELVSQNTGGAPANGSSYQAALSADGRVVAFISGANNLAQGDTIYGFDVFVRDRVAGTTEHAAVTWYGGRVGQSSSEPSLSADGRYVAFLSVAANIVPNDANGHGQDLFVRDRVLGMTSIASRTEVGAQSSGHIENGSISSDGDWVVFETTAGDIVAGDTNGASDVFVRSLRTGAVERVSLHADGTQAALGSRHGSLSADGRRVAFSSYEALLPEDVDGYEDVYVLDRAAGVMHLASPTYDGGPSTNSAGDPELSLDGTTVAFTAHDRRLVPDDTNGWGDVFWRELETGTTGLASVAVGGAQLDSTSRYHAISGNGHVIAFWSQATGVVPGVPPLSPGAGRAYLHDRGTGTTALIDVNAAGEPGNSSCDTTISFSRDGHWVGWGSSSSNLGAGDRADMSDVFVRARPDGLLELGFENEDDFLTPLANGQHLDAEFGRLVTLTSAGPNAGLGTFDSTVGGPNDPSQDRDLLVGTGNLLVLQTENYPPDANDVFPRPNDDEDGGTITFAFAAPVEARSVRLVDLDAGDGTATLTLTDFAGRQRSFTVPRDWTGDLALGQPGQRVLDLTTLAPQPGFGSTASAADEPGFEAGLVVQIEFTLDGSGALDDLTFVLASVPRAAAVVRAGPSSPARLRSLSAPALGRTWSAELDCSAFGSGTALLAVRSRALAGRWTPFGVQLIGGPYLILRARPFAVAPSAFAWAIPADPALAGLVVHAQGLCLQPPGPAWSRLRAAPGGLSNALDLTLGF
jgi:Tol biopolymer transport system component